MSDNELADVTFEERAKLYRFRDDEWKERGLGLVKIYKHKQTGKSTCVLRQEKTLKVVANFFSKDLF